MERLGKVRNSIVSSDSRGLNRRTSTVMARERDGQSETSATRVSQTTKLTLCSIRTRSTAASRHID